MNISYYNSKYKNCSFSLTQYPNQNLKLEMYGEKGNKKKKTLIKEITTNIKKRLSLIELAIDIKEDVFFYELLCNMNLIRYKDFIITENDKTIPVVLLNFNKINDYMNERRV